MQSTFACSVPPNLTMWWRCRARLAIEDGTSGIQLVADEEFSRPIEAPGDSELNVEIHRVMAELDGPRRQLLQTTSVSLLLAQLCNCPFHGQHWCVIWSLLLSVCKSQNNLLLCRLHGNDGPSGRPFVKLLPSEPCCFPACVHWPPPLPPARGAQFVIWLNSGLEHWSSGSERM